MKFQTFYSSVLPIIYFLIFIETKCSPLMTSLEGHVLNNSNSEVKKRFRCTSPLGSSGVVNLKEFNQKSLIILNLNMLTQNDLAF